MTTQHNNKSKKSVSVDEIEAVEQNLFNGEIPAYLKIVNKDTLKVKMCLEVFKIINRSDLEKEGAKFEMELR